MNHFSDGRIDLMFMIFIEVDFLMAIQSTSRRWSDQSSLWADTITDTAKRWLGRGNKKVKKPPLARDVFEIIEPYPSRIFDCFVCKIAEKKQVETGI